MLMKTSSLSKITITEIVQHANLNRGTFYKHYQSKEQLLDEIVDDVLGDLARSYRAPYSDREVFKLTELTASKIEIFEHVDRHAKFYKVIVDSHAFQGFQTRICDVLKQLSTDDLQRFQGTPSKVDKDFLASYSAYALFGFIIEWIHSDFKYTPAFMAEQLMEILSTSPTETVYHTLQGE